VYSDTRNEFLNFGVTCGKFKRDLRIDLKSTMDPDSFRAVSNAYFKRHVIVHNASSIDTDYITQTGSDESLLKKRVPVAVHDIRHVIEKAQVPIGLLDAELQKAVLGLVEKRFAISATAAAGQK
jgi:hypothetical protein